MACPRCKAAALPNDQKANYCWQCGAFLKEELGVLCHVCGTPNPIYANFCWSCGHVLKNIPATRPRVEYCSLKLKEKFLQFHWEAWVNDRKIRESASFMENPFANPKDHRLDANMELVNHLTKEGWEIASTDADGCVIAMRKGA
jgi:hypothetical protein